MLYNRLEDMLLALHPAARRECKKLYIAFKLDTNFVDVIPQASKLILVFNLRFDQVEDPKGWCRDITSLRRWGNGDVELYLNDESQIEYAVGLAEQSLSLQTQE
jgi:predicted transport protein